MPARRLYIGIDPGASGGIAMLDAQGGVVVLEKMPATDRDVLDVLAQASDLEWTPTAVLEFVRSSPRQGVVSAFTFGCGWGALRMALCASQIPLDEVTPAKAAGAVVPDTWRQERLQAAGAGTVPRPEDPRDRRRPPAGEEYGRRNAVS